MNSAGTELTEIAQLVMADVKAPKNSNAKLIDRLLHKHNVNGRKLDVVLAAWREASEVPR